VSVEHGVGDDGCEWGSLKHYSKARAIVMLGSGKRMHRLCEECSRLPRFARLRKRVPIVSDHRSQAPTPHASTDSP
jgi:hypothetical protein